MKFFLTAVLALGLFSSWASAENITMTVSATNSTSSPQEKMSVRQDLPREIRKEDIVETGNLALGFDPEASAYFVKTEIDLAPGETKTFKITIKDVWQVPDSEIDFLRDQSKQRLKDLEGKPEASVAAAYDQHIAQQLQTVKDIQASQKGNVEQRINTYRVNLERLSDIRQNVLLIEDFKKSAARFADFKAENKLIRFTMDIANLTDEEKKEQEVIRYLPQGIRPDHLVDLQEFDLRYDSAKNAFFVAKKIDLAPRESKKFALSIMNLWQIPQNRLDSLLTQTEDLSQKLAGSTYDKLAAYIVLEIKKTLGEIQDSQKLATGIEDRIAIYPANAKKLDLIEDKISQLRKMLEEHEKSKANTMAKLVKSVTPDVATTWKLIWATIIFLTVISLFFYMLWWGQTKAKMKQEIEDVDQGAKK